MQTIYILTTGQVVSANETYIYPDDGGPHAGEVYGGTDFVDDGKLVEIGAVPWREEGPPEGMQATAWSEGLEEGVWVRRATSWEPIPVVIVVPQTISVRQLYTEAELREINLDVVDSLIDALPDETQDEHTAKVKIRNAWKRSSVFERNNENLIAFATALGVTDIDDFFIKASQHV